MSDLTSRIVRKFGNDYTKSGDEMMYHCPFCPNVGKRNSDRKLYVNSKTGKFICFRCNETGVIGKSFKGLSSFDYESSLDIINECINNISESNDLYFQIPKIKVVDMKDTVPYNYLKKRGISDNLMEKYSIRSFGLGPLANRIVIPDKFKDNWAMMYSARAIFESMSPRYKYPYSADKSKFLFNEDNIEKYSKSMIINEGALNSIIAGLNSVAIYGKYASNVQIDKIINKHTKIIYVSIDRDAIDQAEKLCYKLLSRCNSEIRLVELPLGVDACDLGHYDYLNFIENSKVIKKFDLFSIISKNIS